MSGSAAAEVFVDNERTRVTEWRFASRGDNTGWHRHEFDYVVVPMSDGALAIKDADGNIGEAPMSKGVPYFREAGVEHDVISANDFEYAFVEIEMK